MENGTFASHGQMFRFSQYFQKSYIQRRPNVFVWSKGLM